ncbi:Ankyrin repeat domain-containing protein 50 [Hondaea fermentalgiana]|uniref:Ankyrin repeat domain-containing protein 50 n=1 Tax=Hondaea fermentalgiana TaxID=2315210 RepID=A0A2R5GBH2_9STRA|nr:Ankyrin repeat domain-containing protein 50 [Hondaea fermentalgiana]|eukprot:GBG28340.1 Ankyrin repeat domain-containing protein 50 [Hondaea fermentalgiana]
MAATDPAKMAMRVLAEAPLTPRAAAEVAAMGINEEEDDANQSLFRSVLDDFQLDELLSGDADKQIKQQKIVTPDRKLWFTTRRTTQSNVVSVICTIRTTANAKWQNALSSDESVRGRRASTADVTRLGSLKSPFESRRPRAKDLTASLQVQKDLRCEEAHFLTKLGIRREKRSSLENSAAVVLQRTARGFLMRRWLKRNAGRLRLQRKMKRSYQVIARQIRLKLELAESAKRAEEYRERSSIKIQAATRMFLAARAVEKERRTRFVELLNEAATKLCAFVRRVISARTVAALRDRQNAERILRATVTIQASYRMWHLGKQKARALQHRRARMSAVRIQCAWRRVSAYAQRIRMQNRVVQRDQVRAAVLMQGIARGVACRMRIGKIQNEHEALVREAMALSIQRVCRGWLYGRARVRFIRARRLCTCQIWAAIDIQRIVRGRLARKRTAAALDEKLTDIFFQARLGRRQEVEDLHELESCVDMEDINGDSVLTIACRFGYRKLVRKAIKWGLDIDHENDAGETGVMLATRGGHVEIAELLLSKRCKVSSEGRTILHDACEAGLVALILPLLLCEQDANQVAPEDPDNRAPLHLAIAGSAPSIELVQSLIEAGHADVNLADRHGATPLHMAAARGLTDIVRYLVDVAKADVHKQDLRGRTPWKVAVQVDEDECAELLASGWQIDIENDAVTDDELKRILDGPEKLVHVIRTRGDRAFLKTRAAVEAGFPVEYQDPESGLSVLMAAASAGAVDIIRLVANPDLIANQHDSFGKNVFHYAAHSEKVLELLLKRAKADLGDCLSEPDGAGVTALHELCAKDCLTGNLLRTLQSSNLVLGAVRDKEGNTLLHSAAHTCALRSIPRLLQLGLEPTVLNYAGDSPLHVACSNPSIAAGASDLLAHLVACLTLANKEGQLPVHVAAASGSAAILKCILKTDKESKANARLPDAKGQSSLHLATANSHEACLELLLRRCQCTAEDLHGLALVAVAKEFDVGFDLLLDSSLELIRNANKASQNHESRDGDVQAEAGGEETENQDGDAKNDIPDEETIVRQLGFRKIFEEAIAVGCIGIVDALLRARPEVLDFDRDLELAAQSGSAPVLAAFLRIAKSEHDADTGAPREIDVDSLATIACSADTLDVPEILAVLGIESADASLVRRLAVLATKAGKAECLSFLCEVDRNLPTATALKVDETDESKTTSLLHIACAGGCIPCIEILVGLGADKNARDESGASALELASDEVVTYFVAHEDVSEDTTTPEGGAEVPAQEDES